MEKITRKKIIRGILNALLILCTGAGVGSIAVKLTALTAVSTFTIQSNILCLITAAFTLLRQIKKGDPRGGAYIFFKGMALVSILLTFAVYNLVLDPFFSASSQARGGTWDNFLLHTAVPLMALADFIFFEEKGRFKTSYPFGWAVFPLYYVAYTAVYKALGGLYTFSKGVTAKFPYFFLDYETYGLKTVGIWVLLIAIGFIGFSYLLVGLDKILGRKRRP
jgi:hypothetical protein